MLSVAVQKDPMEYKNKIIGSLTARNLACALIAIVVSVAIAAYCYFLLNIPIDISMFIIILVSLPIWAAGFWHPYGMNLEEFAPLWFKFYFGDNVVVYESSDQLSINKKWGPVAEAEERAEKRGYRVDKDYKMLCKRPDFEAYDVDAGANDYPAFEDEVAFINQETLQEMSVAPTDNNKSLEVDSTTPNASTEREEVGKGSENVSRGGGEAVVGDKEDVVKSSRTVAGRESVNSLRGEGEANDSEHQQKVELDTTSVDEFERFRQFGIDKLKKTDGLSDIEKEFFITQLEGSKVDRALIEEVVSRASDLSVERLSAASNRNNEHKQNLSGFDA